MSEKLKISEEQLGISELQRHLFETRADFGEKNDEFLNKYAEKMEKYANFVTARTYDEKLCGLVAFYSNRSPVAFITHVWVSREFRGKEISGRMLKLVTQVVRYLNFSKIKLEVRSDNESALRAYSKDGYVIVGSSENSILLEKSL